MVEVFSKVISAICIIALILVVLAVSWVIVYTLKSTTDAERVLHGNRLKRGFITELLSTSFFRAQRMHWNTVPYNPAVQSDGVVNIENIVVTRGGIMVISTLNVSGYVDNPAHNNWIEYSNGHITPMRNPVELNEANVRAVRNLLRAENLTNIRVHNIVVYTDPSTQFKYRCESLVSADGLIRYIRDLSKLKFIRIFEVKNVADSLRKYRIHRRKRR